MAQKWDACVQTCQVNADDEKERLTAEEPPALQSISAIRHTQADTVMLSSVSTRLQAGTPLSVWLFFPVQSSLHIWHFARCSFFFDIPCVCIHFFYIKPFYPFLLEMLIFLSCSQAKGAMWFSVKLWFVTSFPKRLFDSPNRMCGEHLAKTLYYDRVDGCTFIPRWMSYLKSLQSIAVHVSANAHWDLKPPFGCSLS